MALKFGVWEVADGGMVGRTWGKGQERIGFQHVALNVPGGNVCLFQQDGQPCFHNNKKHLKVHGEIRKVIWYLNPSDLNSCYLFQLGDAGYFGETVLSV